MSPTANSSNPSSAARAQFISLHAGFTSLLGPNAYARRLVIDDEGKQVFHEAGIYLPQQRLVVLSSNRLAEPHDQTDQYGCVVHVPLDDIPPPAPSKEVEDLSSEEQKSLYSKIAVLRGTQAGQNLVLPNGATNWTDSNGKEAVLWCEQGKHDLSSSDPMQAHVHSALVAYVPSPSAFTSSPTTVKTDVLLDQFDGKRFSSLNDVVQHSASGAVFFTDPDYGVEQLFKRPHSFQKGDHAYAPNGVYVWQPQTGAVKLVDTNFIKPNGGTFVPDPSAPSSSGRGLLITTETGRLGFVPEQGADGKVLPKFVVDESKPACMFAYAINYSSSGSEKEVADEQGFPHVDTSKRFLVEHSTSGAPDGIHPDEKGNVWAGHGDGVHAYALDWEAVRRRATSSPSSNTITSNSDESNKIGTLLGKIQLPSTSAGVANFCWAGPVKDTEDAQRGYRLLLFAESELWEVCIAVNGHD